MIDDLQLALKVVCSATERPIDNILARGHKKWTLLALFKKSESVILQLHRPHTFAPLAYRGNSGKLVMNEVRKGSGLSVFWQRRQARFFVQRK
jgi:hypothetical protein